MRRIDVPRPVGRREFIAAASAAGLLLPLIGSAASVAVRRQRKLSWAPPALQNPRTIEIETDAGSGGYIDLAPDTDYNIVIGPRSNGVVARQSVRLRGGRNIVMIGGRVLRHPNTGLPDTRGVSGKFPGNLLNIRDHSGVAHVEGVILDNNNQYGVDAIDVGFPSGNGKYVLQNIHITGVHGTTGGYHADGLQIQGPLRYLLIDRMTVYSTYDGINIQPEFPFGLVWLKRCNFRYPNPDARSGKANGFAFWLGEGRQFGPEAYRGVRYKFEDVFVEARNGYYHPEKNPPAFYASAWEKNSIAPNVDMPMGARYSSERATWPELPVEGYVSKGIPPQGDFCPPEVIVNGEGAKVEYRSPGYLGLKLPS